MKLSQDRSDVFRALCSSNDTHNRVLNSLKLVKRQIPLRYQVRTSFEPDSVMEFGFKVNRRRATEDGVTVIQSPVDHAAGDGICRVLINAVPWWRRAVRWK